MDAWREWKDGMNDGGLQAGNEARCGVAVLCTLLSSRACLYLPDSKKKQVTRSSR